MRHKRYNGNAAERYECLEIRSFDGTINNLKYIKSKIVVANHIYGAKRSYLIKHMKGV